MNKIAITGATGFVGTNLVSYLKRYDIEVQILGREELKNDLDFEKFDGIVHLAGKAHDLKNTSNPEEYYEVNFGLTKKLYNIFLRSNAKKFIFISSVKAVTDIAENVLTEAAAPNPKTDYGRSKLMAEQFIQFQQFPTEKSYYILRPCMIHGPGNKGNLNLLYELVSKGIPWPLSSFDNKRSFCSIDNLLFIIKELIEREDIASGIYNVSDDGPLSTNELINLIAESQNRNPRIWNLSKGFIEWIAKMGDKLHLPLTTERLQKLTESYVVSNEKIKKALGKPLPVSSKEGLLKTFQSFNHK